MNYSIFHTSHCGSTLLAALLSQSLPTITEPRWSHQIKNHKSKEDIKKHIESNLIDGQLTKYSSAYTHVAPLVSGKKVFVYRKLNHHLQKMVSNPEYLHNNLNYIEDFEVNYSYSKHNQNSYYGSDYYVAKQDIFFTQFTLSKKYNKHDFLYGLSLKNNFLRLILLCCCRNIAKLSFIPICTSMRSGGILLDMPKIANKLQTTNTGVNTPYNVDVLRPSSLLASLLFKPLLP